MVLRDLGDEGNIIARGINYYLGVIKFIIIEPGMEWALRQKRRKVRKHTN
jgi:hypothetical protein